MNTQVEIKKTMASGKRRFDLNVAFSSSEGYTILSGPSGSGKSLTLRCIAGITRPDSGRIALGGVTLFDSASGVNMPARARRLGYVFQDYALFPHLTVAQNVGFALGKGMFARPSREDSRRVLQTLDFFEMSQMAGAAVSELSGGQRQRVALARALVAGPAALLLDEPFSALDIQLRAKTRAELKEVRARYGIPLILITHDTADVEAFPGSIVEYSASAPARSAAGSGVGAAVREESLCFG